MQNSLGDNHFPLASRTNASLFYSWFCLVSLDSTLCSGFKFVIHTTPDQGSLLSKNTSRLRRFCCHFWRRSWRSSVRPEFKHNHHCGKHNRDQQVLFEPMQTLNTFASRWKNRARPLVKPTSDNENKGKYRRQRLGKRVEGQLSPQSPIWQTALGMP